MADNQNDDVRALAARHGIDMRGPIEFNEQGLDFRIAFVQDAHGHRWVLRIPRRADVYAKILYEAKVLDFVKTQLSVKVPDWRVVRPELVAYPLIEDKTALTFDPVTFEVRWNIDRRSDRFIETLGKTLAQLHRSPAGGAIADGIIALTPTEVREGFRADFKRVNDELGMREELASFCREWLDDHARWPTETVLIHGDLYAGHVTADANSEVSGIIDWTEAKVSDAALDFAGHLAAFDPESLGKLLAAYERHGGKTWPRIGDQIEARHRASPIRYGLFALETQNEEHLAAAKAQLGSR